MTRLRPLMPALLVATAIAVGLGFGLPRLEAQDKPKAEKTAVAIVNVYSLIAKSQKNVDFQQGVDKERATVQAEAAKRQKKIDQMVADLDLLPAAARAENERKIINERVQAQAWFQIQQQTLLSKQRLFLLELYDEIDKTIAEVAKREGFELVLFDTPATDFSRLNADQLVQAIGNRRVVYREDRVDLTDLVLAQMNQDYRNRAKD